MTNVDGTKLQALMFKKGMTREALAFRAQQKAMSEGRTFTFRQLEKALLRGIVHDNNNVRDIANSLGCDPADLLNTNLRSA